MMGLLEMGSVKKKQEKMYESAQKYTPRTV